MITDISFGQYYPSDSFFHRLDPRFKIIFTIALVVAMFLCNTVLSFAFAFVVILTFIFISKIPLITYLKNLKPLIPIILLTVILNLIYVPGNDVVLKFWVITVTTEGIKTAAFVACRIVGLVIITSFLTYTTTPTSITSALESLLKWLKVFKVDINIFAMMMTIALRFIPTLIDEINKIVNAQKARGAEFDSGNIVKKMKAMVPVLIPLFISSFRRAYELANAMECRCYNGGKGRTKLKTMQITYKDFVSLFFVIVIIAALVVLNRFKIFGV